MVPSVKDNQSTCSLESDQINAVLNTETWEIKKGGGHAVKRARSDPSQRLDTEIQLALDLKYIVPKKLTDHGLLLIGATALGSKKGEEGAEFVSGLRTRLESLEKKDVKNEPDKASGGKGQGKGNDNKDAKHLTK